MGFFDYFKREMPSGKVAKDRLQMAIFNDRLKCSPEVLEMLKTDIIKVISNYLEIDEAGLDINISTGSQRDGTDPVLTADIPIKSWKRK